LGRAVASETKDGVDKTARQLALNYATRIDDDPDTLTDLGPKLLSALEALNLTPRSRAVSLAKGVKPDEPSSALDQLRAKRVARAQTVDTGTS